jgi:hypothetical protein
MSESWRKGTEELLTLQPTPSSTAARKRGDGRERTIGNCSSGLVLVHHLRMAAHKTRFQTCWHALRAGQLGPTKERSLPAPASSPAVELLLLLLFHLELLHVCTCNETHAHTQHSSVSAKSVANAPPVQYTRPTLLGKCASHQGAIKHSPAAGPASGDLNPALYCISARPGPHRHRGNHDDARRRRRLH